MSAILPCVLCNFATSDEDEMNAHFDEKHHNLAGRSGRKRKKMDKNSNDDLMTDFDEESSSKMKVSKKVVNENFSKKNGDMSSKPFKCKFCPKSFIKPKALQNHLRSKHSDKIEPGPEIREDPERPGQKKFRCNFCDEVFDLQDDCVEHLFGVHRVKKADNNLTTFFNDDVDVVQRHEGDQQELELQKGLERDRRFTDESDDLVVQSVSSMIKQQLREKQRSQGLVNSESGQGFRQITEQNPEPNDESSVEEYGNNGLEIKCNLCERILSTRFGLKIHLKTVHPDKDHPNNTKPKINNNNKYEQVTIQVFEANGRTLGVTVKDQMMLSKILNRTCSIQLNLRFSGASKRSRSKQVNKSSLGERHSVGRDSNEEVEHQTYEDEARDDNDEGQSNEPGPAQVDPEASGLVEPDQPKSTLWCSKCGLEFSQVEDLHLHLSDHQSADKEKVATGESLSNEASEMSLIKNEVDDINLDDIKADIDDSLFICVICNQVFDSEASLTKHEDEVHIRKEAKPQSGIEEQPTNREKPFSCSVCYKLFKHWRSKTRHEEKYHGVEPPSAFPENQSVGTDQDPLNKGEANGSFACDICNKSYSRISTLKEHHLMLHEQKLDFECSQCHQGFVTGAKLRSHQKKRHPFVHYS